MRVASTRPPLAGLPAGKHLSPAILRRCRPARRFGCPPPPPPAARAHPATAAKPYNALGFRRGHSLTPVYAQTFLNGNVISRQTLTELFRPPHSIPDKHLPPWIDC